MVVTFGEAYLRDLYEKGKTDAKKHRYQPDVIRRYQKCIDFLLDAKKVEELLLICLLYTSPSPRDMRRSRMPSSA